MRDIVIKMSTFKQKSKQNQQQSFPEPINHLLENYFFFLLNTMARTMAKTNKVENQNRIYANCININVVINLL